MTKSDIIEAIYKSHGGLSKRETQDIVDLIIGLIKTKIGNNEKVMITGFGSFEVVQRQARRGRNPQDGSEITIPERKSLIFHPSRSLQKKINE